MFNSNIITSLTISNLISMISLKVFIGIILIVLAFMPFIDDVLSWILKLFKINIPTFVLRLLQFIIGVALILW